MKKSFLEKIDSTNNIADPLKSQILSGLEKANSKMIFYKAVKKTSEPNIFYSNQDIMLWDVESNNDNPLLEIGFTSLEKAKYYDVDVILECEVNTGDVVDISNDKVVARKCKVLRVITL